MRRLWICDDWDKYLSKNVRNGIRLRFDKGVDPEVKRAVKQYINWLRTQYYFPMRVPIYFKNKEELICENGEICSAIFSGPYDKDLEPYIRVAVGDYCERIKVCEKDDVLATILHSIAHELSHYFQWIKDLNLPEEKEERQAIYYSREIVYDYADIYEHP